MSVTPAGPNWTSNPECKRRCKLIVFPIANAEWTKCVAFVFFSSRVKAGSMSLDRSFVLPFKQKGVCESVCKNAGENALCKCISTNQQMVTERRRLLNRAQLHHHHTHVLSSSLTHSLSLSSLSSLLPLVLFPLLYFHLLSLSPSPLPFSSLSKLVIFVVDLCHLYDFFPVYL